MSYAEAGAMAGVTERTVGRWSRDEANAPAKSVRKIINKLGASPETYGLRSLPGEVTADEDAQRLKSIEATVERLLVRSHTAAETETRVQLIWQEVSDIREHLVAIRDHLGIPVEA